MLESSKVQPFVRKGGKKKTKKENSPRYTKKKNSPGSRPPTRSGNASTWSSGVDGAACSSSSSGTRPVKDPRHDELSSAESPALSSMESRTMSRVWSTFIWRARERKQRHISAGVAHVEKRRRVHELGWTRPEWGGVEWRGVEWTVLMF